VPAACVLGIVFAFLSYNKGMKPTLVPMPIQIQNDIAVDIKKSQYDVKTLTKLNLDGLPELALEIMKFENPSRGEAHLLSRLIQFAKSNGLGYIAGEWGLTMTILSKHPTRRGFMVSTHLDAEAIHVGSKNAIDSLKLENEALVWDRSKGGVGLDDKTGVISALFAAKQILDTNADLPFNVHLTFTVGEELGLVGSSKSPVEVLLSDVRECMVIDRQSSYINHRHVIVEYASTPLTSDPLPPRSKFLNDISRGVEFAGLPKLTDEHFIPSGNLADALEFRGRWDLEVVAPTLIADEEFDGEKKAALEKLMEEYKQATARYSRYSVMKKATHVLKSVKLPEHLEFEVVNLSLDYNEQKGEIKLQELYDTAKIVLGTMQALAM